MIRTALNEVRSAPVYYLGQALAVFAALYFVFCLCFPLGWDNSVEYLRWRAGLTHTWDGKTCAELGGQERVVCDTAAYDVYGMLIPNFSKEVPLWNGTVRS